MVQAVGSISPVVLPVLEELVQAVQSALPAVRLVPLGLVVLLLLQGPTELGVLPLAVPYHSVQEMESPLVPLA